MQNETNNIRTENFLFNYNCNREFLKTLAKWTTGGLAIGVLFATSSILDYIKNDNPSIVSEILIILGPVLGLFVGSFCGFMKFSRTARNNNINRNLVRSNLITHSSMPSSDLPPRYDEICDNNENSCGQVAIEMVERGEDSSLLMKIFLFFHHIILHWKMRKIFHI